MKLPDDAFVLAVMADACFMVHLICLFMKTHLLMLLQDVCLELLSCVFLRKEYNSVLSSHTEANKIGRFG